MGGISARLECTVEAHPKARVRWSRDGAQLEGWTELQEEDLYSIFLDELKAENIGEYICHAHNSLGTAEKSVKLQGKG